MNAWELLDRAERNRLAMDKALNPLRSALAVTLGDRNADVIYQPGDGWCISFEEGGAYNVPVNSVDFTLLLRMNQADALDYLFERAS